ncbi:MAG: bifunctional phosphoribosylaminoimidazolecarboxamide formyltransferase/IMP cyclohydrolase [Bacteroidota bacterium]|nr:bifunctional phosphoribosylaminoimidazolecarboxamide formyltransferase/IMP cyclohydrolase [Bacteroidota bacterium]
MKTIKTALISVWDKNGLEKILPLLKKHEIQLISTGGTADYIKERNYEVSKVEDLTDYPSILGGRVKTLHPKIFGGILNRSENTSDQKELQQYDIPEIDLLIVDLYPFENTLATTADPSKIIEKIDIGGISLIRAGAKNFNDVLVISAKEQYPEIESILSDDKGKTTLSTRKKFAAKAFQVSSHYDTAIFNYFNEKEEIMAFKRSIPVGRELRYGENPHQKGYFFGDFEEIFDQLHGKEISYNNLLDIDSAVSLMAEFEEPTYAVLKHTNPCGLASRNDLSEAWKAALAGDPLSAFGGIIVTNRVVDKKTAEDINKIFFEVIIAPAYDEEALTILKSKKNRRILVQKKQQLSSKVERTVLNGFLSQDRDRKADCNLENVTEKEPTAQEIQELLFANKIVKHTKSNAIVLTKNKQLCAGGVGQTSRVDALKQAIKKADSFDFDLKGAVMASDAFFPFSDSVEIANKAGITAVIQPGGSIKDKDSIKFCNENKMSMVFSGTRHFKH